LETYADEEPEELTVLLKSARREKEHQELVVLSQVMSEEINIGYEDFEGEILKSINGKEVLNLKEVYEILTSADLPENVTMMLGEVNQLLIFEKSFNILCRIWCVSANPR
jgi:hypothetical protein